MRDGRNSFFFFSFIRCCDGTSITDDGGRENEEMALLWPDFITARRALLPLCASILLLDAAQQQRPFIDGTFPPLLWGIGEPGR